jgi:chromate transport protein ChrA
MTIKFVHLQSTKPPVARSQNLTVLARSLCYDSSNSCLYPSWLMVSHFILLCFRSSTVSSASGRTHMYVVFTVVPCILILLKFFIYQLIHKRIALKRILKFTLIFYLNILIILITITLASSNNTLPDDGDWTETCSSCFNVNFSSLFKATLLCISW